MKPTLYSAAFRRICEAEHIKLSADDGKIYASLPLLNLFLSRELTVSLNDGGVWQGVLKRVDADGIQIGDDWRGIEKWSVWFDDCRLGMLTGAELDLELARITNPASYGADASAEQCVALNARELEKLRAFFARDDANAVTGASVDYPLLYRENPETGLDILSLGKPVPKARFGRIQKYVPDFGAGQIVPSRYGEILLKEKIRFIAEDLVNILPREIDTASYVYDVSYTVGSWQTQSPKAENICVFRKSPLRPEASANADLSATAELSLQSGAVTEIVNLPPLPGDRQYGFIYFYRPAFNKYVKIGNLFKNALFISDWTEEHTGAERSEKLPASADDPLKDERDAQINTFENVYLVSYAPYGDIGQVTIRKAYAKRNIWLLRVEGNQLLIVRDRRTAEPEPVPEQELDEAAVKALLQRENLRARLLSQPSPADGERYGFLFYYQPKFSYLRVSNLFVNGGISPNLYSQLGAPRYDKIPNDTPSRLRDPNGGPLNTQFRVYLVAYFPDVPNCGARIVDAYDRQSVSALLALNDKLLLILPPEAQSAEEISRPEQMEASGETQDECAIIDLPPLPEDGSQYALIARYGRSYPLLYFYRAVAKNASGEQYRRWTLAQTNPRGIQFYEGDNPEPVTPDAAFNTLKFAYLVRILPQSLPFGNGVPYVRNPVIKMQEFPHATYDKIEVDGSTLRIYGYRGESIVRTGSAPLETIPPFVAGETLILSDGQNARTEVCPGESFQPEEGLSVYRFGVLTGLLRSPETSAIIGGFLNGDFYFPIDEMNDQTRNIVLTARKRMLLLYARSEGHWMVSRVLPDDIIDIPWKKGTVTECALSVAESFIDADTPDETGTLHSVRHYQSVETDGYVSAAARNGYLKGETVFLKEIVCPWNAEGKGRPVHVAAILHCEREQAIVRYSETQDAYFAYRYNLKTGRLGAVRVPLYGSESALSAATNQQTEIVFAPDERNSQRLYASLPGGAADKNDVVRYPELSSMDDGQTGARGGSVTRRRSEGVEKLPMGQFFLRVAEERDLYRVLREYLRDLRTRKAERDAKKEGQLNAVFSSDEWADNATAAALLNLPAYKNLLHMYCGSRAPTPNAYLRRAFRGRILELIDSGNYQNGELIAHWLPILESTINWTQRARDLYLYLLPCFDRRWEIPSMVRQNIVRGSFVSDDDEMENQEFVKALRDLLKSQETRSEKDLSEQALRLLPQLLALDANSFSFFRDTFADAIPPKLAKALERFMELPAETSDASAQIERIFRELDGRRVRFAEQTEGVLMELSSALDGEESVRAVLSELGRRDSFNAFTRNLDENDRENVRDLIRACDATNQVGKEGAPALRELERAEKRIRKFRDRILGHPTRTVIDLFYRDDRDIPADIHREIAESVNAICRNPATAPEIECFCNVPYLWAGQDSFTLNLLNGEAGERKRREITDVTVSLQAVSSGGTRTLLKRYPLPRLSSGQLRSVDVPLGTDVKENDEIKIECVVEYHFLVSAEYDETSRQYRTHTERGLKRNLLTLTTKADENAEMKDSYELVNPYEFWENKTMVTDSGMFFGRKKEEKDALRFLMDKDERRLIPGRTLLIYGQKRCGKSSFLGKLRKTIRTRDNDAVILYYADIYHTVCEENPEKLPRFSDKFYCAMLDDFIKGIRECRPDITALADEYDDEKKRIEHAPYPLEEIEQRKAALFKRLMKTWTDKSMGRVALIIDEFTRLCTPIQQYRPDLASILGFIRPFSEDWGFVQIIVGHNSMKRFLEKLNIINATMSASYVMRMSALDEQSAREMIVEPMRKACYYNPYETPSGKETVKRLLELSGRYPNYIIFLCDRLFQYYESMIPGAQIEEPHIDKMLRGLLKPKTYVSPPYYDLSLFDPILAEDDDGERERRNILTYLRFIAQRTGDNPEHECDKDAVCDEIGQPASYDVRNTLLKRRVLDLRDDKIHIQVGLFRDYVARSAEEGAMT